MRGHVSGAQLGWLRPLSLVRGGGRHGDCTVSLFFLHTKTQPRTQDAQALQAVEKGIDRNDSQKSALGPTANAMTASSVLSSQ